MTKFEEEVIDSVFLSDVNTVYQSNDNIIAIKIEALEYFGATYTVCLADRFTCEAVSLVVDKKIYEILLEVITLASSPWSDDPDGNLPYRFVKAREVYKAWFEANEIPTNLSILP